MSFAHKIPPLSEKEIAAREFRKSASLADLHERLGQHIAMGPTILSEGRVYQTDHSPLRDIPKVTAPRTNTPAMDRFVAEAREQMGEARWKELNEGFE